MVPQHKSIPCIARLKTKGVIRVNEAAADRVNEAELEGKKPAAAGFLVNEAYF